VNFELTEEQKNLQEAAIKFARAELNDDMIRRDLEEEFDRDGWNKCAKFGLLAMPIPMEHGGLGHSLSELIAVMEGLGYGAPDQGLLFSINAHLWTTSIPILQYGTKEQKEHYLAKLSSGEWIGANAASEPNAGSDVFSMATRADKDGDFYVLNGAKMFVSNAPVADVFSVYATIDPKLGAAGVTAFLVDRDTPGLKVSRKMAKMGLRTSPMGEVIFDNCRIPVTNRLGRAGRGVEVFEYSMEWERGCILANCIGVMRRQLEQCIRHARTRKQFGKAIGRNQSVASRIVDMKVRLETCRPLAYKIGLLRDADRPATLEASLAKLHVSECYVQSSMDAIQIHGGYGYMTEQQVERDLRDAMASRLYSGTNEIQRTIIARQLGLPSSL
jgi:alkylation response protein AidB-like acyl-CoA dehydrogenase